MTKNEKMAVFASSAFIAAEAVVIVNNLRRKRNHKKKMQAINEKFKLDIAAIHEGGETVQKAIADGYRFGSVAEIETAVHFEQIVAFNDLNQ